MSKLKNVIAGLGVITALGVAVLPLTSYADDDPAPVDNNPNDVTAVISAAISMKLISSGSGTTDPDDALICNDPVIQPADPQDPPTPACSGTEQYAETVINPGSEDKTTMYTDVFVSTNSLGGYILTMTDSDADNYLRIANTNITITPINREPVATAYPGWAVRIDDEDNTVPDVWLQVPVKTGTPITVKQVTNPGDTTTLDRTRVYYGVATASDQPSGLYQDTVTYTATVQ